MQQSASWFEEWWSATATRCRAFPMHSRRSSQASLVLSCAQISLLRATRFLACCSVISSCGKGKFSKKTSTVGACFGWFGNGQRDSGIRREILLQDRLRCLHSYSPLHDYGDLRKRSIPTF